MPQTHTRHFRVVRKHNLSVILEMLFCNASVDGKMCHLICVLLSYCRNINFQTFVHWVTNKSIHYVARAEKLFFEIPSTIFCATLKRIWLYCMRNATSKGEKNSLSYSFCAALKYYYMKLTSYFFAIAALRLHTKFFSFSFLSSFFQLYFAQKFTSKTTKVKTLFFAFQFYYIFFFNNYFFCFHNERANLIYAKD